MSGLRVGSIDSQYLSKRSCDIEQQTIVCQLIHKIVPDSSTETRELRTTDLVEKIATEVFPRKHTRNITVALRLVGVTMGGSEQRPAMINQSFGAKISAQLFPRQQIVTEGPKSRSCKKAQNQRTSTGSTCSLIDH